MRSTCPHVSVQPWDVFFGGCTPGRLAEPYGRWLLRAAKSWQIALRSGSTRLTSLIHFLMFAGLKDVKWRLLAVFTCVSLMRDLSRV